MTVEIKSFELNNDEKEGKPVVYSDRHDLNGFTLTLTADSPFPLDDNTWLQVGFPTNVVTVSTVADMTVSGGDWEKKGVIASSSILALGYVGEVSQTKQISIKLAGVVSEEASSHGDVSVTLVYDSSNEVTETTMLAVQQFPVTGARDLTDSVGFELTGLGGETPTVLRSPDWDSDQPTTKINNVLKFKIWHKKTGELVSGNEALKWPAGTPTVQLSFVYGGGVGALTSKNKPGSEHPFSAWNIEAKVSEVQESEGTSFPWVTVPTTAGETPVWTLQPAATNGPVLGAGSGAFATFLLENVATRAPAGSTSLFVSWTGFPGFNDGYVKLPIGKVEPETKIVKFDVGSTADWGKPFKVEWEARNVDGIKLEWRHNNQDYCVTSTPKGTSDDPLCDDDPDGTNHLEKTIDKNAGSFEIPEIKQTDGDIPVTIRAFKGDSEIDKKKVDVDIRFPKLEITSFIVSPTRGISRRSEQTVKDPEGQTVQNLAEEVDEFAQVELELKWVINHPDLVDDYFLAEIHGLSERLDPPEGSGPFKQSVHLEGFEDSKEYQLQAEPTYTRDRAVSEKVRVHLYPPASGQVKVAAAPGTQSLLTKKKILVVARPDGRAPSCVLEVTTKNATEWQSDLRRPPSKPAATRLERLSARLRPRLYAPSASLTLPKSYSGLPHVRVLGKGGDIAKPNFTANLDSDLIAIQTLDCHLNGRVYGRPSESMRVKFGPNLSVNFLLVRNESFKSENAEFQYSAHGVGERLLNSRVTQVKGPGTFLLTGLTFPITGQAREVVQTGRPRHTTLQKGSCTIHSLELLTDGSLRVRGEIEVEIGVHGKGKKIKEIKARIRKSDAFTKDVPLDTEPKMRDVSLHKAIIGDSPVKRDGWVVTGPKGTGRVRRR